MFYSHLEHSRFSLCYRISSDSSRASREPLPLFTATPATWWQTDWMGMNTSMFCAVAFTLSYCLCFCPLCAHTNRLSGLAQSVVIMRYDMEIQAWRVAAWQWRGPAMPQSWSTSVTWTEKHKRALVLVSERYLSEVQGVYCRCRRGAKMRKQCY